MHQTNKQFYLQIRLEKIGYRIMTLRYACVEIARNMKKPGKESDVEQYLIKFSKNVPAHPRYS